MSTRLRFSTKLVEGDQEASLNVRGLLAGEGVGIEPFFILRASDPSAMRALSVYITQSVDQGASQEVLGHARGIGNAFGRWARECGTIVPTDPPVHQDFAAMDKQREEKAAAKKTQEEALAPKAKPTTKKATKKK